MKYKRNKSKVSDKAKHIKKSKRQQTLWQIIKQTLGEFRGHWRGYMAIAAIVFVPSAIIRQYTNGSTGANDYSIVLYLADLFAVLALFWRVQGRATQGTHKIRDLYVASSRRYLPFLLIAVLLAVVLIPFALGFLLIFLTTAAGLAAYYLIGGFLIVAICLFLIIRLSMAIVVVVDDQNTWRRAIAISWQTSRRHWWYLAWSYMIYFVAAAILAGVALNVYRLIPVIGKNSIGIGVMNGLLLAITIPILTIYATNIFANLQGKLSSNNEQGAS